MSEFLPESVRREMEQARRASKRKRSHLKVRAGGQDFTILRYWDDGFALDAEDGVQLRGLVDVLDHGKLKCQALIVASRDDDGERIFEFKSTTEARDKAPDADFVRERPAPTGYITRQ